VSSAHFLRGATVAAGAMSCVAAVMIWGELSLGALLAVGTAGVVIAGRALLQRSGESARPVGRRGLPWLAWTAAAVSWELVALAHEDLQTVSDLADPVLTHPALRGAATLCWLAAGVWLLARPSSRPAAS
jgi:hypothetical protein